MATQPIKTSAGMETVEQTVARAKKMVGTTPNAEATEPSAPPVSKVESPATPVVTPFQASADVESPTLSFLQPSQSETTRAGRVSQMRQGQQGQGEDLYSAMLGLGTKEGLQSQFEEELGVGEVSTRKSEIENEVLEKRNRFLRENERIMQQGGSAAQVDALLRDKQRKQAVDLTDLEIRYAAVNSSLSNLSSIAQRKANIVFADRQAQVDALKFIYAENKEVLNKEEDRLFQQTLSRENAALQVEKDRFTRFEEEKMKYVRNAAQAGASNATLQAIQAAPSLDDLYKTPGIQQYALSAAEKLDMAYKNAQIANINDQIASRGVDEYNKKIEEALAAKDSATAGLQKSLAGSALALELQTAAGLSSAIGFGIKKNPLTRTAAGAGAGALAGAALGPIGAGAGALIGGTIGFFAGDEAVAGSNRADYEAKADKLSAMITLEGRQALKGQGTITDSETALLARAETILANKNVSEEEWMKALQETSQVLNLANQRYVEKYGAIPEDLGGIYGIGANGLPVGSTYQTDNQGNLILPAGVSTSDVLSDEQFWLSQ